jgi:hypothetical protein
VPNPARQDHLLAFACNPFAVSVLMEEFLTFDDFLHDNGVKATEPERSLLVDFECTAKNVLKLAIEKFWGVGINKFWDPHNNPMEDSSDNNEDTMMMDPLEKMRNRNKRQRGPSNANTEDDPVSTCIDDFFSEKFQIHQVMSG